MKTTAGSTHLGRPHVRPDPLVLLAEVVRALAAAVVKHPSVCAVSSRKKARKRFCQYDSTRSLAWRKDTDKRRLQDDLASARLECLTKESRRRISLAHFSLTVDLMQHVLVHLLELCASCLTRFFSVNISVHVGPPKQNQRLKRCQKTW